MGIPGLGGVVNAVRAAVDNVVKTVESAVNEVKERVFPPSQQAVDAHNGESSFEGKEVAETKDKGAGPTAQGPGGPTYA